MKEKENSKLLCKLTKRQQTHTFKRIELNVVASISFSFYIREPHEASSLRLSHIWFIYILFINVP